MSNGDFMNDVTVPTRNDLDRVFGLKYGDPDRLGWAPAMRLRSGYYNPDDHYEALVASLVGEETRWIDVGCGRDLFPSNRRLARMLADRCALLVGVDPDATIEENPFVHEYERCIMDDYQDSRTFDLITLRMVAEHVPEPRNLIASLLRCTQPGALVVIYTVFRYSPVPIVTGLVPFRLHHPVKKFLWRTEAKDTFPTTFRMNTHPRLRRLFEDGGFDEVLFTRLDDCRTFGRFRSLLATELAVRSLCRRIGLPYPEHCLLGVYRRR